MEARTRLAALACFHLAVCFRPECRHVAQLAGGAIVVGSENILNRPTPTSSLRDPLPIRKSP